MPQKVLSYVLQWHPTGGQQNFGIHFWKLAVIAQLKEQNEKIKQYNFKYLKKLLQQYLIIAMI